jgi:PAS domain S-box-containing protein
LLHDLALLLEQQAPGLLVSILTLDAKQCLQVAAAPSLPAHYNQAVEGVRCGPEVGSCGRAAALGVPVISRDLLNDPNWAPYRELVRSTPVRACWSIPLKNQANQILGVLGMYYQRPCDPTTHDARVVEQALSLIVLILEHWRTIHEAEASHARYQALVENAFDAVSLLLADGTVLYESPPAGRMLGAAEPIQIGHSAFRRVHPEDRERAMADFRQFVTQPGAIIVDYRLRMYHYDGHVRHLELSLRNLLHNPVVGAVVVNWRDVTDRAEADQALRTQAQQLQLALTAARLGLWDWDLTTDRIVGHNMAAVLGTPMDAVPLSLLQRWIHPDDQSRFDQDLRRLLLDGARWSGVYRLTVPDQPVRWVQAQGEVYRNDANRAVRVLCVWNDRTEQRQLEQQLTQAQKMDAIGRLAGGVAHDFNNLLTVISGYTSYLLDATPQSEAARTALQEMSNAAQRAADLTQQLLLFSRNQPLIPQTLDLNEALETQLRMLRRLLPTQVTIDFGMAQQPLWILADRGQLGQMVMNLALNAADAMPEGGRLLLQTQCSGPPAPSATLLLGTDFARLLVADTGCGMDEVTRNRIFEPFFTTKAEGKGTGLGLATVYAIVQRFGGVIQVQSTPGQGSQFSVYFPLAQRPQPPNVPQTLPAMLPGRERILLVEDDDQVRELGCYILERQGYRVVVARNGAEALVS